MSCDCCGEVVRQLRAAERAVERLASEREGARRDVAWYRNRVDELGREVGGLARRNIALRGVITRMKKARKG